MEPRLGRRGNMSVALPNVSMTPASMEPRLGRRGNGTDLRNEARQCRDASMEPRLGRRGNVSGSCEMRTATPLQWSPGLVAGETWHRLHSTRGQLTSFNGAPAWSPGKPLLRRANRVGTDDASMEPRLGRRGNRSPFAEVGASASLQWSPGLVAGETGDGRHPDHPTRRASMEPRLGRRGNLAGRGPASARHGSASMEPRLGRRGNLEQGQTEAQMYSLQWSPGLVAGETRVPQHVGVGVFPASMEPRLGRRGNGAPPCWIGSR